MWKRLLTGFLAVRSVLESAQEFFVGYDPAPQGTIAKHIITEEFSAFVDEVRELHGVRGLSLGIVKADGSVELGGWGNSTETGDPVNEDVSAVLSQRVYAYCTSYPLPDSLRYRV